MPLILAGNGSVSGLDWAASGGGLTKITTQSFTAVSAININNCFSSSYQNYKILFESTAASAAAALGAFRLRVGGADNTTANYQTLGWYTHRSGGAVYRVLDQTYWDLFGQTTGAANRWSMDIFSPQVASYTQAMWTAVGYTNQEQSNYGGLYFGAATVFDGFTFYPASSTITGSLTVYGYTK